MEAQEPQFILKCASVYLGPRTVPRVGTPERAIRFASRKAAERRAKQLRGRGRFHFPWTVVPAPAGSGFAGGDDDE